MHGVPSSAARDARDEATSIHAAAAVATALAAAAEEGLEDDGRGDALHHIAEAVLARYGPQQVGAEGCATLAAVEARTRCMHEQAAARRQAGEAAKLDELTLFLQAAAAGGAICRPSNGEGEAGDQLETLCVVRGGEREETQFSGQDVLKAVEKRHMEEATIAAEQRADAGNDRIEDLQRQLLALSANVSSQS
mmetsp:Transcript_15526/g.24783  ORF Transcript_15526/g.24783 Transcript_15526/m.24783 type:complete len:193 (+) Transcript_15526:17-595(+)